MGEMKISCFSASFSSLNRETILTLHYLTQGRRKNFKSFWSRFQLQRVSHFGIKGEIDSQKYILTFNSQDLIVISLLLPLHIS